MVLPNRLVKAAMSDSLGDGEGNRTDRQIHLYERWLDGGAALAIIGEVQVDARYAEKPGDLVFDASASQHDLRRLAAVAAGGVVTCGRSSVTPGHWHMGRSRILPARQHSTSTD